MADLSITTDPELIGFIAQGPYTQELMASGGSGPHKWEIAGGAIPGAMRLSENGVLMGTSHDAGNFKFVARVRDSAGGRAEKEFTLKVYSRPLREGV